MNCIEKLYEIHKECFPCKGKIIEFEQLPEYEKYNFDSYDKKNDFIVYCEKCEFHLHLNTDKNENIN